MNNTNSPTIVLGSTSPFRKALLDKLNIQFETDKPEVDETAIKDESANELVERLSLMKAKAVAPRWDNALVIGSDQVALFNDEILGKPHTHENAVKQLTSFSGNKVTFLTGLTLFNTQTQQHQSSVETFEVHFKELTIPEIEAYLLSEKPYNCAGSFKSEALGITLFEKLIGDDPNTLVGLPLIKLIKFMKHFGYSPLENQKA